MGMERWSAYLSEDEQAVFEGYGFARDLGSRAAVLAIDFMNSFVDPGPLLESARRCATSCGERAWRTVAPTQQLLARARSRRIPVIYLRTITTTRRRPTFPGRAVDDRSLGVYTPDELAAERHANAVIDELAPCPQDVVLDKRVPSGFFGTPLVSILNELAIDTLIMTGGSTSGCLRATVVDAVSYSFTVGLVEACIWDRFEISHQVNLMDMQLKYATLLSEAEAEHYLSEVAVPILAP
jgi:maleamate amidohydrolase